MSPPGNRNRHGPVRIGVAMLVIITLHSGAEAQVTSSGLATVVTPAGADIDITGGTQHGPNLFHSFGSFSVDSGQTAAFLNEGASVMVPGDISNILGRVTGGSPSSIFGTLDTLDFPGANLFLMNPAGMVFGPDAALHVDGSFHATTADSIKLGNDGGVFYANPATGDSLNVSAPSAFGFLSPSPGSIEVRTGGLDGDFFPTALLEVPEGETLSLVGGDINVGAVDGSRQGYLLAPAGRINLVSVASPGDAVFDGKGFNVDGFAELGDIKIGGSDIFDGGSIVDAKEIFIRGGRLVIDDGVVVPGGFAFELSFVGLSPLPDGGEVNIDVRDEMIITGTDLEPLTFAPPGVFVYQGDFFFVSPESKVPEVRIDAGSLSVSGFGSINVNRNGPGESADVRINTDTLSVGSGGSIFLVNAFEGPGPNLIINAKNVDVSGDGSASPFGFEGIAVQGLVQLGFLDTVFGDVRLITGDSGSIAINASEKLSVTGLGQITTDSRVLGSAADINLNVGELSLVGTGDPQSAVIASQSAFTGNAGNIFINTQGPITVKDGARITSATLGSGNAGDVNVNAGGPMTLAGEDARVVGATFEPTVDTLNGLFDEVFFQDFESLRDEMGNPDATLMEVIAYVLDREGILDDDLDLIPGDGGTVTIASPQLTLNAGTRIETSTGWDGEAGAVVGNVGALLVKDGAAIRSRSGIEFIDGSLGIGPGNAGEVNITANDTITVTGRSPATGEGSAITTSTLGDGDGGAIRLAAREVQISDGGIVSADSEGGGLTGNISIIAGDAIRLTNGTVSTRAVTSDGGNIVLEAPNLVYLLDSKITTSVESGVGGGGNIFIDPQFVVLQRSQIIANAFGGPGGNIRIVAGNFIATPDSAVTASSAKSIAGTVQIDAPDTDVSAGIAVLPESFLDASALLRQRCGAARTGTASSLVASGRGGVPADPDGYLPSYGIRDAADTRVVSAPALRDEPIGGLVAMASGCSY